MPELPDVEGFRRVFNDHAVNRRVERVIVRDSGVLRGTSARTFRDAVRGKKFRAADRHGKWLIAPLVGGESAVLLHFGMTGALEWSAAGAEQHRHDRIVFEFAEGDCPKDGYRRGSRG